nr:lactate racemase domain-containing protein [Sedimentibacter sp.]
MSEIDKLLSNINIPKVVKVKQYFNNKVLLEQEKYLIKELNNKDIRINCGDRIAITAGSRGIDKYVSLMRTIVSFVKSKGAIPFIVPAMGSHGGSTADGQENILKKYGITEENVGAPIKSSTEVVQIGETDKGLPVLIDKNAYNADGIILFNRIKPHTAFRNSIESGLIKMLAIGLAKPKGAQMTHYLGLENMPENIMKVGKIAVEKLNIVCGIATLENGYCELSELHVIEKKDFFSREPVLLKKAWEMMSKIYLDEIDVLIVKEIGKEISGSGMDTNIVGRYANKKMTGGPNTIRLGVLDLTEYSNGNANGMGYADFATKKLIDKTDFVSSYMNTLTSTEPAGTKMPMILENDKMVFQACVKCCHQVENKNIRMVIIKNTKYLDEVYMSEAAVKSVTSHDLIEICDEDYKSVPFDENGCMILFD